ncbi:hypothetical protein LH407_11340 [Antiquaquibacter oligotrophicus]|uniref:hypothetical protein n=1 Tax=Antiquaquibacter oligotrophicus TaxID=2880260 RepID=UPI002AC99CE9|nr:hypothetical protein [Antiquaquibacter oligotrophicus]UDF12742.1 hypothetical protein LH407_11340 [Antiquaquibacter oligotrophicus]
MSPALNVTLLANYLATIPGAVLLVEDMLLRKDDGPEGQVHFSGEIGLREVPISEGAQAIVAATSWMSNSVVLSSPTEVSGGAVLDEQTSLRIYDEINVVITSVFDAEAYIAFEITLLSRNSRRF